MATSKHRCILCKKERAGRFTKRRVASGGGWDQGRSLPAWYCWVCLPAGEGRDETAETQPVIDVPAKKSSALSTTTAVVPAPVDKDSTVKESTALATAVAAVIITDQESYTQMDGLLARIQTARKLWNIKMYGTAAKPGPIPNIRTGLEQLYELNREVDKPLEKLEEGVKKSMKDFKLAEIRQARQLEAAKEEEQRRLKEEERKAEEAAAAARTAPMKARLEAKRLEIVEQQAAVAAEEAPEAVVGTRSSDRKVMKWRLEYDDEQGSHLHHLLMGIIEGVVPSDAISLNVVYINKQYKDNPALVKSWPGIEEYEDVQIVGR